MAPSSRPRVVFDLELDDAFREAVDPAWLKAVVSEALDGRVADPVVSIGILITDDEGIQEINRQHRGVDSPTDVLSFPLQEFDSPERLRPGFPRPLREPLPLGDLVLSYPRAVSQAADYGHSLDREVAFLLVHGVMHLLGYDHEAAEDQAAMRREEEAVLQRMKLER